MAATDTLTNLQNYVAVIQKDKDVVSTSRNESYLLNKLMSKKKTRGGAEQQFSIKNGDQADNTNWFKPDDSASDIVGGSGSNVYQSLDPIVNGSFSWSYLATDLRYSDLQLQAHKTAGASQLAEYLESRLEFSEQAAAETIGNAIINGTGDGKDATQGTSATYGPGSSSALQPYGTRWQCQAYGEDSTDDTNRTSTSTTWGDNLHFGLPRHLHPELVGNVLDAAQVNGTAVSIASGTFVVGSTEVTISSTDVDANIGWEVWIDWNSSGNFVPLGREYLVAAQTAGAQTTLTMTQVFRAQTSGGAGAYPIELRAPFDSTNHGAANVLTLGKMRKSYYQSSDGMNQPDLAYCSTRMFGAVQAFLTDSLRWNLQPNSDMKLKGYDDNFMFLGATFVADNNMPDSEIMFENTKYLEMFCLEGRDDYKIKPKDIIQLPSQTGHEQFGCAKTMAFQVVNRSPRSSARLLNLEV